MMNQPPPPKKRKRASAEDIEKAVKAVKSGRMTVHQASAAFTIPKSTISDHITGKRIRSDKGTRAVLRKRVGRSTGQVANKDVAYRIGPKQRTTL